jgi:hypothetical protein
VKPGNLGSLLVVFLWSIFMGVTAVSIGFGALFPSMNRIAKPFVCADGNLEVKEHVYHPYPGRVTKTVQWFCVDPASGAARELSPFVLSFYAGPFYGLLIFAAVLYPWYRWTQRRSAGWVVRGSSIPTRRSATAEDVPARMEALEQLHARGLVSEDEFERKRREILGDL